MLLRRPKNSWLIVLRDVLTVKGSSVKSAILGFNYSKGSVFSPKEAFWVVDLPVVTIMTLIIRPKKPLLSKISKKSFKETNKCNNPTTNRTTRTTKTTKTTKTIKKLLLCALNKQYVMKKTKK